MITSITGLQSVQAQNKVATSKRNSAQGLKSMGHDTVQFKGVPGKPKTDLPVEILRKVSEFKDMMKTASEDDSVILGNAIGTLSKGDYTGYFKLDGSNGTYSNHYFEEGTKVAEEIVNSTGSSTLKLLNIQSQPLFHFDADGFLKRRQDHFPGTNTVQRIRQFGDGMYGKLNENTYQVELSHIKVFGSTLKGVVHEQVFDKQGRIETEIKQDAKLSTFLKRPGEVLMRHDFYMDGYDGPKSSKITDKSGQVLATFHNRPDRTTEFIKIFNPERHGLAQLIECDEKGGVKEIIQGGIKREDSPAPSVKEESWTPPKEPELDIQEPELPGEVDTSWMDPPSDSDPEKLF